MQKRIKLFSAQKKSRKQQEEAAAEAALFVQKQLRMQELIEHQKRLLSEEWESQFPEAELRRLSSSQRPPCCDRAVQTSDPASPLEKPKPREAVVRRLTLGVPVPVLDPLSSPSPTSLKARNPPSLNLMSRARPPCLRKLEPLTHASMIMECQTPNTLQSVRTVAISGITLNPDESCIGHDSMHMATRQLQVYIEGVSTASSPEPKPMGQLTSPSGLANDPIPIMPLSADGEQDNREIPPPAIAISAASNESLLAKDHQELAQQLERERRILALKKRSANKMIRFFNDAHGRNAALQRALHRLVAVTKQMETTQNHELHFKNQLQLVAQELAIVVMSPSSSVATPSRSPGFDSDIALGSDSSDEDPTEGVDVSLAESVKRPQPLSDITDAIAKVRRQFLKQEQRVHEAFRVATQVPMMQPT